MLNFFAIVSHGLKQCLQIVIKYLPITNLKTISRRTRVYTVIKVDDRRDLENRTLDAKVDMVEKMLR